MKLPLDDIENLLGHHKHHKDKHHHKDKEKDEDKEEKEEKEDKDIPDDWKERCPKHEDWCDKFLLKIIKEKKEHELFGKVKPPTLNAKDKELLEKACKSKKYHKKKWCLKVKELELKLWDDRKKLEAHGKRAANEAADDSGSSAIWFTVGGLLLFFLILGIVLYVYVYKSGKKERTTGKGSTPKAGSKLKSRRSKSGKSKTGFKSRLASKSSGKKSPGSRKTAKKSSKNLGSKKSSKK